MWGWLAWQIGGEKAFSLVAGHDQDRVAPGGDLIKDLLTTGAGGRPVLLLLDEVLKYMERAAAVAVLDSTLQRQAKDFFQSLTVEVSNSRNAAMVYSLQWSAREALGNIALLQEMDKLAARVDQLREPVTGDEILPILQRRLLGATPDPAVAGEVAASYQKVVTGMRRAYAETPTARQQAEEEGVALRDRMQAAQERLAKELFAKYGDRPRKYRNGIGLAIPEKRQIEALRRAVRYLLAIERVEGKKQQFRLSKDQLDQLRERRRTEEAAAESAFRALYASVWLPRVESGSLEIERIESGGRPLQAAGVHERMMELLTSAGTPKVHSSVTPRKIIERLRLGESTVPGEAPRLGIRASEVVDAFFSFLEPPRLDSVAALRKAIARGIAESTIAYTSGYVPSLGPDGCYQLPREKIVFGRPIAEDEIDLETGFLIMPAAVPQAPVAPPPKEPSPTVVNDGPLEGNTTMPTPVTPGAPLVLTPGAQTNKTIRLSFIATRDQVFKAFPAIANLAEKSDGGKVVIRIEAASLQGFDPAWLRNAVEEPLAEADVELRKDE